MGSGRPMLAIIESRLGSPGSLGGETKQSRPGPWSRWLPPPLAYVAVQLLFAIVAGHAGHTWFSVDSRTRADSGHYLAIARHGYRLFRCGDVPGSAGYPPDEWCGNAGWYPLYAFLTRGLSILTGLRPDLAGVLLAEACVLGTLILVWLLLGGEVAPRNLACLALACVLPAGVYYHAVFPMSLAVLLALLTFLLLRTGHWVPAGLAGALLATSYPIGVLLAPAAGLYLLLAAGPVRQRLIRAAVVAGTTALGMLAVLGMFRISTGRFDAHLLSARKYGVGLQNPFASFQTILDGYHAVQPAYIPTGEVGQVLGTLAAELWFSTALVGLGLAALAVAAVQRRAAPLDWALGLYGLLMLVAPLVAGPSVAQFRSHTLLLPVVLLLRLLPVPVPVLLAVGGSVLAPPVTLYFLEYILI
jgi:hypothetical protein